MSGEVAPAELSETFLAPMLGSGPHPAEHEALMRDMMDLPREHWLRILRRALTINERPPVYFERPAIVVHGRDDAVVPLAWGEELARGSDAELMVLDTDSHMMPLTHAAELANILYR